MKGCQKTATTTVSVRKALVATANIFPLSVCSGTGQTVTLTATANGGNPTPTPSSYTYTWSGSPGGILGAGSQITITPTTPTTYTVSVSDGNCPRDTFAVTQVVAYPPPSAPIMAVKSDCEPNMGAVTLDVNLASGVNINNPTFKWSINGKTSTSQVYTAAYAYNPNNNVTDSTVYVADLEVTSNYTTPDNRSCKNKNDALKSFSVYQVPKVRVDNVQSSVTELKPDADFYCNSEPGSYSKISNYVWDFGDGRSDSSRITNYMSHTYAPQLAPYDGMVTVTSSHGCVSTAPLHQVIEPVTEFWIPDAFTPNGDGKNDTFGGTGVNVKEYEMYIYDRWGNMIFYSHDIEQKWDGKAHSGSDIAQQDVYIYKIIVTDYNGKKLKPFTGRVTLIR